MESPHDPFEKMHVLRELLFARASYIYPDGSLQQFDPTDAGNWFIRELNHSAKFAGAPLSAIEEDVLGRLPTEDERWGTGNLINRSVPLLRRRIELYKDTGAPTLVVRRGLRLPVAWQARYEAVYLSELPWLISAILQATFMGNPLAGERKPWKSK